jgi:hypothetical protein
MNFTFPQFHVFPKFKLHFFLVLAMKICLKYSCKWFACTLWQHQCLHMRRFSHNYSPSSPHVRPALIILGDSVIVILQEQCVFLMSDKRLKKIAIAKQRIFVSETLNRNAPRLINAFSPAMPTSLHRDQI